MGRRTLPILTAASLAALAACASSHNAQSDEGPALDLSQVSAPARATIQRQTAAGTIDKITKESERGRTVYDVEATVNGRHAEWTIADSDGAVLGREWAINISDLPAPVRAAAEAFFDKGATLTVTQGEEYGQITYEIVGPKNGKKVEKTWDPSGHPESPEH